MEAEKGPDIPEFDRLVLAVADQMSAVPPWIQESNAVHMA